MWRIDLGEFSFAVGRWLLIGIFLVIGYVFWNIASKKQTLSFPLASLLPDESKEPRWIGFLKHILIVILILLISLTLSRPQTASSKETVKKEGIDIVLALDVSQSMLADDFSPNRLDAAKEVLAGFLSEIDSDRVSMVVFAGKPFVSVPLTFDYGIFQDILKRTTTDTINQNVQGLQGTAIGDALLSSISMLEKGRDDIEDGEDREQVVVLLTDGTANVGIQPTLVATSAAEKKIKIYTVGIGSPEGGFISFQTPFGMRRQKMEGIDEATLKEIAKITDARYRRATDEATFQRIFEELQQLEQSSIESEQQVLYTDTNQGLLLALFLLSVICVSREWRRGQRDGS